MKNLRYFLKSTQKTLLAAIGGVVLAMGATGARADTVISITQTSYNYRNQPVCTAVRMNMAISQPADACAVATTVGANGPDRVTQNVYDAAGQVLAVYQGVGTSSIRQYAYYNYTNNGLKAFEIDANHNKTTYTYDGFDRLSKVQYPNLTAGNEVSSTTDYETFGYDANSNRTSWRHRNAQTVLYTFDNLNRETFKDLPAYAGSTATSKDIYTGYDGLGHILYKRFASASGSGVSYTYDGLGRVSSTTDMNSRTVWYGYFADSTRYYMQFPDSIIQGYAYDNKGALTATSSGSVGMSMAFNSLGKTIAIARSNGANSYYAYDNAGRLNVMALDFAGVGNDVTWWITAYNPANQITNWNASSTLYDYVENATTAENKTYDGLNRDASIAAVSGGYDSAGNLANDGSRVFTYDVENRLLTGSGTLTALNMEYDPEGRLYRYSYNGTQTNFLYDGTDLIAEYDSSGNMLKRYMHMRGTDQPWVQFTGAAVTTANATYLYSNYQGSIIATADQSGNVTDMYKYGPYGEPRNSGNAESWSGNRFRYTGQIILPEAKLYYYKARVYDPNFGRFLQTDPVGSKDDLDLYAYVGGDPINRNDSSGLFATGADFCGVTGCVGDLGIVGRKSHLAFLAPPPPPVTAAAAATVEGEAVVTAGLGIAVRRIPIIGAVIAAVWPSKLASQDQDEPRVTVYRAISAVEYKHLQETGNYGFSPHGGGKYFALTLAGAENVASKPQMDAPYVTMTRLLPSVAASATKIPDPGLAGPSLHFEDGQLPTVYTTMTPVTVLNPGE